MNTITNVADTPAHQTPTQPTSSRRFRQPLGLVGLVLFGLAYMVPLAVFTTYGLVTQMTKGHLPTAYLLTLAAMLLTAYSYGCMVKAHPYSGSVYTYTRKAFGASFGFIAGWTQLVFIVVFVGLSIHNLSGQAEPVSLLKPFHHEGFSVPLIMTGAAVLCLSFLGFDAVSTMAEETPDPRRTIPQAIMAVSLIGGLLFLVVSYCAQMVFPEWNSFADPDSASVDVMRRVGGELLVSAFTATYVAGCFASAMVSQASVSRVLFAMGRDGALPRVFGKLVTKKRVPANAIMLVSLFSLIALFIRSCAVHATICCTPPCRAWGFSARCGCGRACRVCRSPSAWAGWAWGWCVCSASRVGSGYACRSCKWPNEQAPPRFIRRSELAREKRQR